MNEVEVKVYKIEALREFSTRVFRHFAVRFAWPND
jgi:hypothetical protein